MGDAGGMSGLQLALMLLWWAGVAALLVWASRRKARKKREAAESYAKLQAYAATRGWRFEKVVPGLVDAYQGAEPLPVTSRGLPGDNVVSGAYRGFGFRAFEHRVYNSDIDVDGVDSTSVTVNSFWALDLGVDVPDLRVYQDGWFDTVTRGRAMQVGNPQLQDDFHIVSSDEERAREVLSGGLAKFLTSDPRARDLGLRLHDRQLITWRTRSGLSAESIEESLDYLVDATAYLDSAWGRALPGQG